MVPVQERGGPLSKLMGKFTGPYRVEAKLHGNKFLFKCRTMGETHMPHVDHWKKLNFVNTVSPYPEESQVDPPGEESLVQMEDTLEVPGDPPPGGSYNLHSRSVNTVTHEQTNNAQGDCRDCSPNVDKFRSW